MEATMKNNKTRDLIVVVVSLVIFIGAILFILESMGGGSSEQESSEQSFEPITEEVFVTEYDASAYESIKGFTDYGKPDPSNLGKDNIFKYE